MNWQKIGNPFLIALLRSPLHGLLSQNFAVLTLTGRRSGKPVTLPVNYLRNGEALSIVSFRHRTWWRNLRGGAPVTVQLAGQTRQGHGEVFEDTEAVAAGLVAFARADPRYARYYGVTFGTDGQPHTPNLPALAAERVLVRITLVSP